MGTTSNVSEEIHGKAGHPISLPSIGVKVYAICLMALALLLLVPWLPQFPDIGLDNSWVYAMNEMVARHVGFDSDLFFTYGPYASAYTQLYGPATGSMMVFAAGLCAVAMMAGFLALAPRGRVWILVFAPMLASINGIRDARFLVIPFLLVTLVHRLSLPKTRPDYIEYNHARGAGLVALILACGILPLIKVSFGTLVFGSGAAAAIIAFRRDAKFAVLGIALFIVSLLVFWIAAGQDVLSLWSYWHSQAPLVSGFSDAMALDGPSGEIVAYLACAGALFWLAVADSWEWRRTLPQMLWLLSLALLLFIAFKAGFVRGDHLFIALVTLQLAGVAFFLQARFSIGIPALIVSVGCCVAVATTSRGDTIQGQWQQVRTNLAHAHLGLVLRHQGKIDSMYRDAVDHIVAVSPIKPSDGANDIYPFDQSLLLASGKPWAPRPALQGYETYASSIQKLDADFLETTRAPSTIFYSINPLDNQYPSLQDGLSWPNLLTRYKFSRLEGDYAVLSRANSPSVIDFGPSEVSTRTLGETVSVPSGNVATWAKIDIKKTLAGRLASLFLKAPNLSITVTLADGSVRKFKYVAGMGQAGFFLSPLVTTTREFVAMKSQYPELKRDNRVVSFSISTSSYWDWIWSRQYSLSLAAVHIQPDPSVDDSVVGKATPLNFDISTAKQAQCYFDLVDHKPYSGVAVSSDGVVFLNGWAAIDPANGIAPDDAFLLVENRAGRYIAHINRSDRPDVGVAFKHPEMKAAGLSQAFDLRSLRGDNKLSILQIKDGKPYICSNAVNLSVR